jgi:hypothetical protein
MRAIHATQTLASNLKAMSAAGNLPKELPMKKLLKTLLVAGVMSTAAMAAFSQSGHTMMEQGMGHGDKQGMRHMDPAKMDQMVAKHMADLKAKLKITASQEGAWNSFTTAMKPSGEMTAMGPRPDMAELEKLPMPQRMDKMRALRKERMTAMDAGMDKREDAAKALYAVLSPEQQKVADAEHAKMMGRLHGKRMHMGLAPETDKAAAAKS